jgi:hypothetical protein
VKKVIIALIIVVLVLGIGTGGVLFWGRSNANADKAYANKANTLVSDFEKKYSSDNVDKTLNNAGNDVASAEKAIDLMNQAKTDAQNSLNELNKQKASKRVASIQKDAQDYFNITIKTADNALASMSYAKTLIAVGKSIENASGGEVTSLDSAITTFQSMKDSIDKAIVELDKASVPEDMKDYNAQLKQSLSELSRVLGQMIAALKAGDLSLFASYADSLTAVSNKMAALAVPDLSKLSSKIISSDDKKRIDAIPGEIAGSTSEINKKTFAF